MNAIFDINKVYALIYAYKSGKLGGEKCLRMKIQH